MKYKELLEKIKNGGEITFSVWGGYNYSIDGKHIDIRHIIRLEKEFKVKELRSKISPLLGKLKIEI